MSFPRPRMRGILAGALLVAAVSGGASAQTPKVFYACYVPLTGTVYRIKEATLKTACTTGQVEFSWTDGAGALRTTDAAGGDLGGVFATPTVVGLLGRALSTTAPTSGQVLAWNGTEWTPTTPASGGVTSHAALTGLAADDHPQYLLANGARSAIDGFAVAGTFGGGGIAAVGTGPSATTLLWYPRKGAFRAGTAPASGWTDLSIGSYSTGMGSGTTASGNGSTALGLATTASSTGTTAMGFSTTASGLYSTALGWTTFATGESSTSMGSGTHAVGDASTAMGVQTFAVGNGSTSLGQNTIATGTNSSALGFGSTASGATSTAMGYTTTASGASSTAMGYGTTASGQVSTAMGYQASTDGKDGSFVYGDVSTSSVISATAHNQFTVRAAGGFRFRTNSTLSTGCDLPAGSGTWSCTSSRLTKEGFADLSGEDVLTKIGRMSIQRWNYRTDSTKALHVGPTAQDFRAAFGLGSSDEAISLVDMDGINMLGVQALVRRTTTQSLEIHTLRAENSDLRARLERLEAALKRIEKP